ncbi:T9SS type A sorting domain-containing protein [Candidatus Poribacteria bacterium]|nr:T9SS type A sorting domain-containing protein [Candidatus Poribacteria bacterium]MYA99867.1 T9SS type A sorting domain-containing protein [Candidatus Poribacteria bacterium]
MPFKHLFFTIILLFTFPFTVFAQEHTYFRDNGSVKTVAYSPVDASVAASGGGNRAVKLWDLQNDTVTTLGSHADTVNSVAFSPDGQLLVSGGDDYACKLWDIPRKRRVATFEHIVNRSRSQVKAVDFSDDGQLLATAGVDVKLWSVQTRAEIGTLEDGKWVLAVAFSPDGRLLATGDETGQINVWNVQRRQIIAQFIGDAASVYTVKFSPDGKILAGAGYTGEIELWKVENWEHLGTLSTDATVSAIDFSPDSSTLASTGYKSVNLWKVESGEKIATLTEHRGWVNAVAFSPETDTLISGGDDETLRIWDITPYDSTPHDMVRIIYFLPRDRSIQPDIWNKLDTLIRDVQSFYANQMEINGFGRKTFTFETDENGDTLVYRVDGQSNDWYYHTETQNKVYTEIASQFDMEKHAYLIVVDISSEAIEEENTCGVGGGHWLEDETVVRKRGGYAVVPASGPCFDGEIGTQVTAHELGHAFGLEHDFRNDAFIMSYGAAPDRLSPCAAGWLAASRFFNTDQTAFNEPTILQMLTSSSYTPNAENLRLQFEVTDVDGIHQIQLLVPTTAEDPASGTKLHSCKDGHAHSSTIEFDAPALTAHRVNDIALQVIDVYGNITRQDYTLRADDTLTVQNPLDVNGDGVVNIQDLVLVASSFGQTGKSRADVNGDEIVNISDLVLVASALGEGAAAAPTLHPSVLEGLTAAEVQDLLRQARQMALTDPTYLQGIAVLEQFLALLLPKETVLFVNYPNPFNPETWIPYQLAEPADVTLYIHSVNGVLVRTLELGHQSAGVYRSRSRAAYWNGRNEHGEAVASGIYFYTLTARDFTATRKMLIQK